MLVFYQISTNKVFSYVSYNERDTDDNLIKPALQKCADNNSVDISDINVKIWTKLNPVDSDFKDLITELSENDLENF